MLKVPGYLLLLIYIIKGRNVPIVIWKNYSKCVHLMGRDRKKTDETSGQQVLKPNLKLLSPLQTPFWLDTFLEFASRLKLSVNLLDSLPERKFPKGKTTYYSAFYPWCLITCLSLSNC